MVNWLFKFLESKIYPWILLPKVKYKVSIDCQNLKERGNIFLHRHSNLSETDVFDELGLLRIGVIELRNLPNCSLNLLGFFFKVKHAKYRQKRNGTKPWDGKKVSYYKYMSHFTIEENRTNFYFNFDDLYDIEVQYPVPKNTPANDTIKTALRESKEDPALLTGKLTVEHKPTYMNYWHFQLSIQNHSGSQVRGTSQVEQLMLNHLFDNIISICVIRDVSKITNNLKEKHLYWKGF